MNAAYDETRQYSTQAMRTRRDHPDQPSEEPDLSMDDGTINVGSGPVEIAGNDGVQRFLQALREAA